MCHLDTLAKTILITGASSGFGRDTALLFQASRRRTHMSLFAMFKSAGPTGFGYGSTAEQVTEGLSLAGQTILVTGCNSGIGQEACRVLALRGALVLGTAHQGEGRGGVRDLSR